VEEFVCRKKWLILVKLNVDSCLPGSIDSYIDNVKSSLSKEKFDEFFEAETMVIYIPVKTQNSNIEIQEIILNDIGSDKYEFLLKDKYIMIDNHIRVTELLSDLKEIINDSE
jgi:hypothetical protein